VTAGKDLPLVPVHRDLWLGLGVPVALLVAVLLLEIGALAGSQRALFADSVRAMYPLRVEAARQWSEGHLPLWNSYKRAGAPLTADIVAGALYPGNVPFLFAGETPGYLTLQRIAVLHSLLGALFMFLFLRTRQLARIPAAIGALIFVACGFTVWITRDYVVMQNAAVWLPMILLAVHRAASGERFWRWTALGAGGVALQTLAGYPEYVFYSAVVAAAYGLSLSARGAGRTWRPLAAVTVIYLAGAGLGAVQILPTLELAAVALRPLAVAASESLQLSATPDMLLSSLVPHAALGAVPGFPPRGAYYWSLLAIVLAAAGMRGLDRKRLYFTLVLVIAILLALGTRTPVGPLAYAMPGFSAFRYPYKHLFEATFALAALAAIGADDLLRGRRGSRATIVTLTALALGALALAVRASIPAGGLAWAAPRVLGVAASTIGALAFAALVLRRRPAAALLVAGAALWSSYASNRAGMLDLGAGWEELGLESHPAATAALREGSGRVLSPDFVFQRNVARHLVGDFPSALRIPAVHGAGPFLWAPLGRALTMPDEAYMRARLPLTLASQVLDVLAGRYVLAVWNDKSARLGLTALGPLYRPLVQTPAYTLFERQSALPMLRFVEEVTCTPERAIEQALRARRLVDAGRTALVDCNGPPVPPGQLASPGESSITVVEQRAGYWLLRARVPTTAPGFLVVSQADLPGWRASVDGQPAALYRAYGLVQGVAVPPGEHEIRLVYLPRSFLIGASIMVGTAVLLLSLLARESLTA